MSRLARWEWPLFKWYLEMKLSMCLSFLSAIDVGVSTPSYTKYWQHVSISWSVYGGGHKDAKPRADAPKSVNSSIVRRSKSHTMSTWYDC